MKLLPTLEQLGERIAALEAERAVRWAITRYMALCDVPCNVGSGAQLAMLFAPNAIWEGLGPLYAAKFGRLQGHEQILAMLTRYLPPTEHFRVNLHFLTSEAIEVRGTHATGRWIMLQASDYIDAGSGAELIAARLTVDFEAAADGGDWLMTHFRTERIFNTPWHVTAAASYTPQDKISHE